MLLHFYDKLNDWDVLFFLKISTIFYRFSYPISLFLCKMTEFFKKSLRNSDTNYIFRYVKYFWNKRYLNIHLHSLKGSVIWNVAIKRKRIIQDDGSVVDTLLAHSELLWEETMILPGTSGCHPPLVSTNTSIERNSQPHTSQESQYQNLLQVHLWSSPKRQLGLIPPDGAQRTSLSQFCPLPFSIKGVVISLINSHFLIF